MNTLLLNGLLMFGGVPQKDIADLDNSLPECAALCRAADQLMPLAEEAAPLLKRLFDLIQQMEAIAEPQQGNFLKVLPVVQEFIAFANSKK